MTPEEKHVWDVVFGSNFNGRGLEGAMREADYAIRMLRLRRRNHPTTGFLVADTAGDGKEGGEKP